VFVAGRSPSRRRAVFRPSHRPFVAAFELCPRAAAVEVLQLLFFPRAVELHQLRVALHAMQIA
jgi:hypothetical protein